MRTFLAALVLLASPAVAHDNGEPNWITTGKYNGPDGIHCCGPNDCDRLDPGQITVTPQGYLLRQFNEVVPFAEATPSEDKSYWRCHRYDGQRRCFFAPIGGS